jgi:hypothetical protein
MSNELPLNSESSIEVMMFDDDNNAAALVMVIVEMG